jgi:transmembrane sensor
MAWTLGRLVFRNASVAELSADLRRWYGVELRVTDSSLLNRHFTGSFGKEPANRVLDVIALALGAHVDRRGDTAYIRTTPLNR